jgi:hypothetical protein
LLAHGWWFSPGTPASSTTKTGRHDIAEILLKVALKYKKSKSSTPCQERGSNSNTTLVMIGTDCTGSCKTNYHTITTMTALRYLDIK